MKNLSLPDFSFDKQTGLSLGASLVYVAYMIEAGELPLLIRFTILLLMLYQLLVRPIRLFWFIWLIVFVLLAIPVLWLRFDLANHHYVLTYLALAFFVSSAGTSTAIPENIAANARWMLVLILGFATLHRLLSPTFPDGSYIGFMLSKGGFFSYITDWFSPARQAIEQNQALLNRLSEHSLTPHEAVVLQPPVPYFGWVTKGIVWMMLVVEVWLGLAVLLAPGQTFTHLSLLAFVGILSVMRQELEFISILTLVGYAVSDDEKNLSKVYLLLIPFLPRRQFYWPYFRFNIAKNPLSSIGYTTQQSTKK